MNKSFTILLVLVAIWGVSLGLAFIVGLTIGKTQSDVESPAVPVSTQNSPPQADEVRGQFGQGRREDLRQRIESGEITQEELDRFRQQFREGSGEGGRDGSGFRRRSFGDHADGQNGDAFSGQHATEEPTPQPSN